MWCLFRHLVQPTKEKTMAVVIAKLLRHGLTIAGGAGMFSNNQVEQIAGALSTIAGIAWSLYEARRDAQAKAA
jgi:hypothetical protein